MARVLSRRTFLRGAGVAVALPWLDAMSPPAYAAPKGPALPKKRMVAMCYGLSLHPDFFFPTDAGKDYKPSKYLEVLKDFRNDYTVFSGLSNPGMEMAGGHGADVAFLTGAPGVGRAGGNVLVAVAFASLAGTYPPPLNYAVGLACFQVFFVPTGIMYWLASRTVAADMADTHARDIGDRVERARREHARFDAEVARPGTRRIGGRADGRVESHGHDSRQEDADDGPARVNWHRHGP